MDQHFIVLGFLFIITGQEKACLSRLDGTAVSDNLLFLSNYYVSKRSTYRSSSLSLPFTACQVHHVQFTNTYVALTICPRLQDQINSCHDARTQQSRNRNLFPNETMISIPVGWNRKSRVPPKVICLFQKISV